MAPIRTLAIPSLLPSSGDDAAGIADWLIHCADPLGPRGRPPRHMLSARAAGELIAQAEGHGILAAVLRQFPPFRDDAPAFAAAKAEATLRYRTALSVALMLAERGDALMADAAELRVAMVKGPVFARMLYPDLGLRPFGDIDLLAAPDGRPALEEILAAHGFVLVRVEHRADPQEWKWLHRDHAALMVELQTDLVHAQSLRGRLSLTYDHLAAQARSPAGLLIVAVIHGSMGAHFAQLRNLVDICQAARAITSADEERSFEALVAATGARLAACTALTLAGRVLDEPRCLAMESALGGARYAALAGRLIDRSVIMSTLTRRRWIHSWRRQAFRHLLKQ